MKREQREPTKPKAERSAAVFLAFRKLRHLRNFPQEQDNLEFLAACLGEFVETVEIKHGNPEYPDPGEDLGWVVPLDWLMVTVAQTFEFFPAPIKFRVVYEQKFCPLDGKGWRDLVSAVEE